MNNKMFCIIYWIIACSIRLIISESINNMYNLNPKITTELSLVVAFPHLIRNRTLVDASTFVEEIKYTIDYPILTAHTLLYQSNEKDTWSYGSSWSNIPPFKLLEGKEGIQKDLFFSTLKTIDDKNDLLSVPTKDRLVLGFVDTFPETELGESGTWKLRKILEKFIDDNVMFIIFATEEVLHNWMVLQIRLGAKTFSVVPLTANLSMKDIAMILEKVVTESTEHIFSGKGHTKFYLDNTFNTLDFYDKLVLNHKKTKLPYHVHLMYFHPYRMSLEESSLSRTLLSDYRLCLFKKYISTPYTSSDGTLVRYNGGEYDVIIETQSHITDECDKRRHSSTQFAIEESLYNSSWPNQSAKTLISATSSLGVSQFLAKYISQDIKLPTINLFMIPVNSGLKDIHTIKELLDPLCYLAILYNIRVIFTVLNIKTKKEIEDTLTNVCFAYTVIDGNFFLNRLPHVRDEIKKLVTSKNVYDIKAKSKGVSPWMDPSYPIKYDARVMFVLQKEYNNFQDATSLFFECHQYIDHLLRNTFNRLSSLMYRYSTVKVYPIRGVLTDNCSAGSYAPFKPMLIKHVPTSTEKELSLALYKSIQCITNVNINFNNEHALNIVIVFLDNASLSPGIEGIIERQKSYVLSKVKETHTHLIIVGPKGFIDNKNVLKTGPWTVVEIENKYELGFKLFKAINLV